MVERARVPDAACVRRTTLHLLHLPPQQRFRLRQLRATTHNAALLRRCLTLLQLDQGQSVAEEAAEFGVTRQSVYNGLDH